MVKKKPLRGPERCSAGSKGTLCGVRGVSPQLALLPLLVNRFLRNVQNATISREGDSVDDYIIFEFGANIERWSLGNYVDHNVAPLWYEG